MKAKSERYEYFDEEDKEAYRAFKAAFGTGLANIVFGYVDRLDVAQRLRLREIKLESFEAHQECPACGVFGFHLMKSGSGGSSGSDGWVVRECGHCGHEWKQK